MRLVQRGIANNFGLVGKNIRRYLTTTALTATGLMAIATPALAEGSWSNMEVISGGQTVTTPDAFTTNIETHTMDVSVRGDANIAATDTVNVFQLSDRSKYIVHDTKSDPTKIMGKLNANGRVYIFDKNGVIFGESSEVNVGGIVTSTGHISETNLQEDKHVFEDVGGDGEIVNNGSITVAEGGLAAFVAPSVRNNGVINAKAGTVALASGNKVTLDLYGDGLVSIATEGELSNALVENKGVISASGGNVALTVAAAKDAVDSVVNMDGIIDVSSTTGKGGKVKINGGNKGAVNITGKIDASGQGGGDIDVTGENILATSNSVLDASAIENGKGGNIKIWGNRNSFFFGNAYARGGSVSGDGGFVEVSAADSVGYAGLVDTTAANGQTGRFLIDPQHVILGTINPALMVANIGLDILLGGTFPALVVDQQALANTLRTTDVDLWATSTISTAEDIDISEYNYSTSTTTLKPFPAGCGVVCRGLWALNPANYTTVITNYSGITENDLTLAAPTVNLNHDVTLGFGKLLVKDLEGGVSPLGLGLLPAPFDIVVNTLNLNGRIYKRENLGDASFTTLADDGQIYTSANTINIVSNNALIQQGIYFADEADAATINVAAGTYAESVLVERTVKLQGANVGKAGFDATRGSETIVDPSSPGFKIQADNVTIDGFLITGATGLDGYGVWVDVGADNATIKNNVINDVAQNGVFSNNALNTVVENNQIDKTGSHGVLIKNGSNASVLTNHIGTTGPAFNINGDGIQIDKSNGTLVKGNQLTNTTQTTPNIGSGVHSISSNNVVIEDNKTWNTDWDGVRVNMGNNALVKNNDIDDALRTGIYLGQTTNSTAIGNDIDTVGNYGINLDRGSNVTADGNFIDNTGLDGIRGGNNQGSTIKNNQIGQSGVAGNIKGNGIIVDAGRSTTIDNNKVGYTVLDGINVLATNNAKVTNNVVTITGGEGIEFLNAVGTLEISKNNIDDTESHGILVGNSANTKVLENLIGLDGGALNINGDGIQIMQSNGVQVKKNKIANSTQTAPNIGSGVHSISSNNVVIEENKTDNTGWDGVRVNLGDNVLVKNNDIDNAFRTGVYLGQTTNSSAIGNDIDKVGNYGINLDRGSNVTADGNFIDATGLDGIRALRNGTSTIKNNQIGQTGVAGNIKGNGIIVDGGTNSTVDSNKVGYTVLDGIHVISTTNASVTKNDIDVTGDEGIHLIDAKGTLLVSDNTVDKTKKHGIRITNSDAVSVLTNKVGLTGGAFNINGDGIRVEFSDDVLVQSNQVTNTKAAHNNQGNGVQSIDSNRTKIFNNTLWNTNWDGVRIDKGTGVVVSENDIDNVTRSGVFAINTNDTLINYNTIDYVGHRGVYVSGGKNITIDYNDIDYALGSDSALNDGIRADGVNGILIRNNDVGTDGGINNIGRNGVFVQNSKDVSILSNTIQNAVADGIYALNNTNPITIELNDIDDVGGDGIDVYGFDSVLVKNNDVRDAVGNGILVQYGQYANVTDNVGLGGTDNGVSYVGKNGIKVGHVNDIDVTNNEVQLAGWDGIHVEYFNTAYIAGNLIEQSGDDGIEAHDGVQVEITGNTVLDSGYGILVPGDGGVDYDGYDEFNSGHDGIHVTNIYGYGKIIASRIISEIGSAFIRITGNTVDLSADDGIDVDNSQAYTYVVGNTVSDSGVTDNGDTVIYDGVDSDGADSISIENVGQPYYFGDAVRKGDIGNGEYNIVVSDNEVTNSLDDGIEIVGSYLLSFLSRVVDVYEGDYDDYEYYGATGRVLVSDNTVLNSGYGASEDGFGEASDGNGGDGIHVSNIYPGYYGDFLIGESEGGFYGYAVDVLGNNVTNSGDDGIEVINSESTLIDDNTVKNSGFVSDGGVEEEPELKLLADSFDFGADGIHVRNVGYYYERIIDEGDEGPIGDIFEKALPGYGYTPFSVVIRRNDVDNSQDNGIQVHNSLGYPTAPVLVEINENVSNSGNQALYISGPSHSDVIVRGNAFSNFDTGGQFESGLIDLSQAGNTWTDGNIGLRFSPTVIGTTEGGDPIYASLNLVDDDGAGSTPYPTTPTNFGGTIGAQTFTGFTEDGKFYVYLDDGAFTNEGTPIWINGLNSNYDGIEPSLTGGLLTEDTFNYLEARFQHFPDNATTDIFWFGFFPDDLPLIEQSLIFNRFNIFNGDVTGLNVQITSLPSIGGGAPVTPAALNAIGPFAGNEATDPDSLNQIETAAGGENQPSGTDLNNIETASGGQSQSCWGNAVAAAGNGQVVNVVYTGGFTANLNQAATCGTGF